eukprot:1443829-Pleurochrysis_carterae.AAC.4
MQHAQTVPVDLWDYSYTSERGNIGYPSLLPASHVVSGKVSGSLECGKKRSLLECGIFDCATCKSDVAILATVSIGHCQKTGCTQTRD